MVWNYREEYAERMDRQKWNLIFNELRIMIDPFIFAQKRRLIEQVSLISTFPHYFELLDPSLCRVQFYFPLYLDDKLGYRRTFMPDDDVVRLENPPQKHIQFIDTIPNIPAGAEVLNAMVEAFNDSVGLAVENKCAFLLSDIEFLPEKKYDLRKEHNVEIVSFEELKTKIEQFLQGFYNYFKFSNSAYGIRSPDLAHSMSDGFLSRVLIPLEVAIHKNQPTDASKERIRSFVHNRYADILVAVDQIRFFALQQRLHDIEYEIKGNTNPHFHGFIRYHLNYYLYLLWGSVDHLAWIINDLFAFGFDPDGHTRWNVGFVDTPKKKPFLDKVRTLDPELYAHITSEKFQDWLNFLGQIRHKSAHRELFTPGPLLFETPESKISDSEIDAIIYKDEPVIPPGTEKFLTPEFIEEKKRSDRQNYRISKMQVTMQHVAQGVKNGQNFIYDPVARVEVDLKELRELVEKVYEAYKRINAPSSAPSL